MVVGVGKKDMGGFWWWSIVANKIWLVVGDDEQNMGGGC